MNTPSGPASTPIVHPGRPGVEVVGELGGLDLNLAEVRLTLRRRGGRGHEQQNAASSAAEKIRLVIILYPSNTEGARVCHIVSYSRKPSARA